MRLSYDDLVRQYLETLNAKLRNFAVEPEFVATWVHDEDDHRSLYDLFVAAQGGGCRDLTVVVGAERAARLDAARLDKELGVLGAPKIARGPDGTLEVAVALKDKVDFVPGREVAAATRKSQASGGVRAFKRREVPAGEIDPSYRAGIESRKIRFEGALMDATVSVSDGGATLCVVLGEGGVVAKARHSGAAGALRALLDVLCEVMEGRPLQEAADHAVIRMEASLRDRSVPAPVEGLLTPRTAGSLFEAPERLVRVLYRERVAKTGEKAGWNYWDDAAAEAWGALPEARKLEKAKAAVAEAARALGLPPEGIEVVEVMGGVRVVLAHTTVTAQTAFGASMMRIEGLVKKALDARIELQLESLEDRNRRAQRTARTGKV